MPGHFTFDHRALLHCHTLHQFLLVVVLLLSSVPPAASQLANLSIPLTSPSFVYTPYVCNATEVSLDPTVCQAGWQMSDDSAQNVEMMTTGSSKPILPQVFFRFRASGILITTSSNSNATVDMIVAWDSVMRRSTFDSMMGCMSMMDLPDNSTFLLTLTVNPSTSPTLFGLTSIKIAAPPNASISSILPSPITPSSAIPPKTSTSQSANASVTTTSGQNSQKLSRQMIRLASGLTVGLGVGLTLVVGIFFWFSRSRRESIKDPRWSFVIF